MDGTEAIVELVRDLGAGTVQVEGFGDRHSRDWAGAVTEVRPAAVAYPRTTEEVAAILRACHAHGQAVVPQGGLTGLAGGGTPVPGALALSLERMAAIEEVDPAAATLTAQAGATLQAVQEAADGAGFLFPLDIGGRGSCRLGGNVSTNAGGNRVLRFGMARDLVLGLEVVLADGAVVSSLNKMIKNNAGYDLKHLFIGSEGTLGVVTRVVLRLHPKPRSTSTALLAAPGYPALLELLALLRDRLGGRLSAFEAMWPDFWRFARQGLGAAPLPLDDAPGDGTIRVLVEAMGQDPEADPAGFEDAVAAGLEAGCVADAVVAQSGREAAGLWRVRDQSGELRRRFSPHVDFDVSIPTGDIGRFVADCTARLRARKPDVATVFFGHVADSNLHLGVQVDGRFSREEADRIVYGCVRDWRGSISAEHGIGTLKRPYLDHSRSDAEIALMRRIKQALDPAGILNPGKVL